MQQAVRIVNRHLPLIKLHPEEFWVFPLKISACFVASARIQTRVERCYQQEQQQQQQQGVMPWSTATAQCCLFFAGGRAVEGKKQARVRRIFFMCVHST
jgi:hypothetical protein